VADPAGQQPNRLLAELTSVMRATAQTSRQAALDQCRADAKAYVELLRARIASGGEDLNRVVEDDVKIVEKQSKSSVERVRAEAEQRISRRREILEQEVQEYRAAVDEEVERVKQRVSAFEKEISDFFEQLEGVDPATFATMAQRIPGPPSFADLDMDALGDRIRKRHEPPAPGTEPRTEGAEESAGSEELPPGWWLDSPARLAAEADSTAGDGGAKP
jgi:ABC-type transporter Mla subunit MlaD